MDERERYEQGLAVRREVLGEDYVHRALAQTTTFTGPFQELITRYAWGEIWTRPGLDRKQRSLITLSMLAALRHWDEFRLHLRAALRNGLTSAEIQEVLLQVAIYCGVPTANHAFKLAKEIVEEGQSQSPA
jgi:4-carboxymuconolactone decarboxylase